MVIVGGPTHAVRVPLLYRSRRLMTRSEFDFEPIASRDRADSRQITWLDDDERRVLSKRIIRHHVISAHSTPQSECRLGFNIRPTVTATFISWWQRQPLGRRHGCWHQITRGWPMQVLLHGQYASRTKWRCKRRKLGVVETCASSTVQVRIR